ncbi:FliH/SctL family protein [Chitiniphilus shinanonensis]|uniref:FliH/SctL family protein n=1 Tax=Chitiniphilus shinanonensis TaxID=553088 RepID=UPI001FDEBEE3|nr:FliH/SctL family protein [Chitiniphilus shinanonensis]
MPTILKKSEIRFFTPKDEGDSLIEEHRCEDDVELSILSSAVQVQHVPSPSQEQMDFELHRQLEELKEKAYQEGLTRGMEEGERNSALVRNRLGAMLDRIPREVDKQTLQLEEVAISVALAASVRIVGEHALDHERALATVRYVLGEVRAERITCLHLSPGDYEFLTSQGVDLGDRRLVRIIPSARVEIGGCIVDTESGSLDARYETQLERVRDILKKALKEID